MEKDNFDFTAVFKIVLANWKVFLLVGIASGLLAVFFSSSLFLKPRFKSVAVVYPVNLRPYSDESETEQLLQVFQSSDIRDSIIEKFDLYERYNIPKDGASPKYYLHLEYYDRVVSSKTIYESVRLEVFDENPEVAKAMADEILSQITLKIRSMYNERMLTRSESYRDNMRHQRQLIDTLEQELKELSQSSHLVNYESQSRELMRAYADVLTKGGSKSNKDLQDLLDDLQASGSMFQALQNMSYYAAEEYGNMNRLYLEHRAFAVEDVEYLDVLVHPEIADKKAWPVRWLILVTSIAAAMIFTLIGLAIFKK